MNGSNDELSMAGFEYETSTRATLPAQIADEGTVLVSGRLLSDIVKSLPNHTIDVSLDGSKVSLVCGSSKFSLQTLPVDEYPDLPDMPRASGRIPADVFAQAVAQAGAAAGRAELLPLLTGVRLELEGETLSLMATDRFRASLREVGWQPQDNSVSAQASVPARVLSDTARALTWGTVVTIAVSEAASGYCLIGWGGGVVAGRRRAHIQLCASVV